jgi:hypothetical protein
VCAPEFARHYPAVPLESTRPELVDLVAALAVADVPVAVGGSRTLDASRSESDYDLVIYGKNNVDRVAKVITELAGYAPETRSRSTGSGSPCTVTGSWASPAPIRPFAC